jgi:ketosteroid isomerase-like protein
MITTNSTDAQIRELGQRWVDAEQSGDVAALDEMSTEDFTMVGPLGFVLDRNQWLQRYRTGELVTRTLVWDQLAVRDYGDAVVVVGQHTQQATFKGNPVNGSFRATHIAVRRGSRWLLAGIHMSPIGGPPPFVAAQNTAG